MNGTVSVFHRLPHGGHVDLTDAMDDGPQKVIDTLLDHPITRELEKQPDYQKVFDSPDMQQFRQVVAIIEGKLGAKWRPAISTLSGDGIYAGVDLATQGVVVLVHSRDAALLEKARATFIELARADAKEKSQPDPIKEDTYECGVETEGPTWVQFNFRYYYFALLFVIFDVEAVFLYPWAVAFTGLGVFGLVEMVLFIGTVLVAYVYVWRRGGLEWD